MNTVRTREDLFSVVDALPEKDVRKAIWLLRKNFPRASKPNEETLMAMRELHEPRSKNPTYEDIDEMFCEILTDRHD